MFAAALPPLFGTTSQVTPPGQPTYPVLCHWQLGQDILMNEDKISVFPATDRDVKTEILSDVILLELKSFAAFDDK